MNLFLLMEPPTVTAQQAKIAVVGNKPIFYKPEKVKAARQMIISHLRSFKPDIPYDGPLVLHVIWKFPKSNRHKNF